MRNFENLKILEIVETNLRKNAIFFENVEKSRTFWKSRKCLNKSQEQKCRTFWKHFLNFVFKTVWHFFSKSTFFFPMTKIFLIEISRTIYCDIPSYRKVSFCVAVMEKICCIAQFSLLFIVFWTFLLEFSTNIMFMRCLNVAWRITFTYFMAIKSI